MNDRVMKAKYPGRCRCSSSCRTLFEVGALIVWDKQTKRTCLVDHMDKLAFAIAQGESDEQPSWKSSPAAVARGLAELILQRDTILAKEKPNGRGVGELSVRKLDI